MKYYTKAVPQLFHNFQVYNSGNSVTVNFRLPGCCVCSYILFQPEFYSVMHLLHIRVHSVSSCGLRVCAIVSCVEAFGELLSVAHA